jgi:hypothetical protein
MVEASPEYAAFAPLLTLDAAVLSGGPEQVSVLSER